MRHYFKILIVLALCLTPLVVMAQGDGRRAETKPKPGPKSGGSYLKEGKYVDANGGPVDLTWCSTGWTQISGSNPARYFCSGIHWGEGPLAIDRTKASSSGYLQNGNYLDAVAGQLNLTYCSTGWNLVAGSSPVRYACGGTVFGSGPLALDRNAQKGAGYLESGTFIDEKGNPVEFTYCSTGWQKVTGSNPARWTCAGLVIGSGPLNLPQ